MLVEECRRVTMLRMLIIKLALRAYELDHGALPQSLSQLVPDYLPTVPIDPFSDKPFHCELTNMASGYTIRSFGPDRDDDNGQPFIRENGDLTDAALFPLPPVVAAPAPGLPSSP